MQVPCYDCPRRCGAVRTETESAGICASPLLPRVSRAAPHYGEEPCISGTRGAGTIFFTGCSLRCVFCQNHEISRGGCGELLTVQELRALMLRMRDSGVHNIELVTASHFIRAVAEALDGLDLGIPVVWNSSGYESVDSLRMLEGLVQVYLPDFKYARSETARRYSAAADYPEKAVAAIDEMVRQCGPYQLDADGLLQRGVLIRHLILPGHTDESRDVIDEVADRFPPGTVLFSLMSQYTPMPFLRGFPELRRRVSAEENASLIHYMQVRHLEDGYWQEPDSSGLEAIPLFDGTGLDFSASMSHNTESASVDRQTGINNDPQRINEVI